MAGISSSTTGAAPPPPEPPVAEGHGGDAHNNNNNSASVSLRPQGLVDNTSSPLLEDQLEQIPGLFDQMVIPSSSAGPSADHLSPPPPEPPAAEGQGRVGAKEDDDNTFFPLLNLLERSLTSLRRRC
jgi:hypothetical protein